MKLKKQNMQVLFLSLIVFSLTFTTYAIEKPIDPVDPVASVISAYRSYKDVGEISIKVPTVVEIPFVDEFIERFDFAILNKTTNAFEPHFFRQETFTNEIPVSVSASPDSGSANHQMSDNDTRTYADFPLPDSTQGQVVITLSSTNPITSSALTALLDNNVALPSSVEIRAMVNGQNRIVVANQRMNQETVRFPQTISNQWIITFTFGQPLRISELVLNQDNVTRSNTRVIRFLAQPTHQYRIYLNSDRSVIAPVGEAGNLVSVKDVLKVSSVSSQDNASYVISDIDADKIPDIRDNCVSVANPDQLDVNKNERGDVCDDFDQDGLINSKDNCPDNPNANQADVDNDKIGDACDKEESRITEKHKWLPWVGMGFAGLVLVVLFAITARGMIVKKDEK